jgi:hypothetical protein
MADYFTRVSFIVPLDEERAKWANQLLVALDQDECLCEAEYLDISRSLRDEDNDWTGVESKVVDDGLWVIAEDNANVPVLMRWMQYLTQRFDINDTWGFEWAHDGTRPLLDAYGGGACAITKSKIETMTTCDWLTDHSVQCCQPGNTGNPVLYPVRGSS